MPDYLSNTPKSEVTKSKVETAAKISRQDVRYEIGPMPADGDISYNRNQLLSTHDCIVGYEKIFDYSKFWKAMREQN